MSYIYYTEFDGNQWLPCQKLSQESLVIDGCSGIAADSPDNIWVVFARGQTGGIIYATHFDGSAWSSEERLDPDTTLSTGDNEPVVALDRSGYPWVAWEGTPVGGGMVAVYSNHYGLVGAEENGRLPSRGERLSLTARGPASHVVHLSAVVPQSGPARLDVFDETGKRVRSMSCRFDSPGRHDVEWDGREEQGTPAPNGAYFCRLRTKTGEAAAKAVLLEQ
jgi:hypothetical protein